MDIENNNTSEENPLVSIIVITYNSAKFVLETLESAKAQTYQNIELIVSDDCSTDDTVEICEKWIEENKSRFVDSKIIRPEKNTGIAPNCNRGLYESNGDWVKFIAGDDTLLTGSIASYIEFSIQNPISTFIVANINITNENGTIYRRRTHPMKKFSNKSKVLLKNILKSCFISAPGIFIKKNTLVSINGFDERFEMQEDYPLFLKLAQRKIQFYYLNEYLVNYRQNNQSIWHQYKSKDVSSTAMRHFNSTKKFYTIELLPALKREKMFYTYFRAYLYIKKEEKRLLKKRMYQV